MIDLTTAQQKIVQITRALLHKPKILVLDEPTAALIKREVDSLFVTLRRLRQDGIAIVYVSHYMQEIEDLCDRVTVLRNGAKIATVDPKVTPMSEIIGMMIARDLQEMFPKRRSVEGANPRSRTRNLGLDGRLQRRLVDRSPRGEIVGLTGLLGSGAKELLHCIYGLKRSTAGDIVIAGQVPDHDLAQEGCRSEASPWCLKTAAPTASPSGYRCVRISPSRVSTGTARRVSWMPRRSVRGVDELIQTLAIKTSGREALVRQLSGGNQQKVVVLAKWLSRASSIYVLDEPTVAIDVGSKVEIYHLLNKLAAEGAGILMLSTDLLELVGMCDRIAVMYRGRITRTFEAAETSERRVAALGNGRGE